MYIRHEALTGGTEVSMAIDRTLVKYMKRFNPGNYYEWFIWGNPLLFIEGWHDAGNRIPYGG